MEMSESLLAAGASLQLQSDVVATDALEELDLQYLLNASDLFRKELEVQVFPDLLEQIPEWPLGNWTLWNERLWNKYNQLLDALKLFLVTLSNRLESLETIEDTFLQQVLEVPIDWFQWNTVLVKEIAYRADSLSDRSEQTGEVL